MTRSAGDAVIPHSRPGRWRSAGSSVWTRVRTGRLVRTATDCINTGTTKHLSSFYHDDRNTKMANVTICFQNLSNVARRTDLTLMPSLHRAATRLNKTVLSRRVGRCELRISPPADCLLMILAAWSPAGGLTLSCLV